MTDKSDSASGQWKTVISSGISIGLERKGGWDFPFGGVLDKDSGELGSMLGNTQGPMWLLKPDIILKLKTVVS